MVLPSPTIMAVYERSVTTEEAVPAEPLDEDISIGEGTDSIVVPTIFLSDFVPMESFDERVPALVQHKCSSWIVAENIATSTRDTDVFGGRSTRMMDYSNVRPEFISVTFYKSRQDDCLGLTLSNEEVRISSIMPFSMASDSPLRPGDKILSVDGKHCSTKDMDSASVARILQSASGDVTIVVHNQGGRSDLVESMIMKSPDEGSGLRLKSNVARTSIVISSIRDGSKFANSILNAGDVILQINQTPCGHLSPVGAAKLITNNPYRVTVLARTFHDTGLVVAEVSDNNGEKGSKLKQVPVRFMKFLRHLRKEMLRRVF